MKYVKYSMQNYVLMRDETTLEFKDPNTGYTAFVTVTDNGEVLKDGVERRNNKTLMHINWDKRVEEFARSMVKQYRNMN